MQILKSLYKKSLAIIFKVNNVWVLFVVITLACVLVITEKNFND